MFTDILIAVGIGAVIMILLYAISASARTAQKGNAPVAEPTSASKPKKQQKTEEDAEEAQSKAKKQPQAQQQQEQRIASPSPASNASSSDNKGKSNNNSNNNKKKSSVASSSASSSGATSPTNTKKVSGSSKVDKKAAKKARDEEEEAELDAIVEAEMKRSVATGIRKEKFEIISLDKIQQAKDSKAQRQEKKAEGATFNEKQIAVEKAAGFRVVGAQEAAKKEAQSQAKSSSPASREDKKSKKETPMTREEELDAALRSVLSKRGNKRAGDGGAFRTSRNEETASPDVERGFVELKGEVKASRPGGAWGRSES